MKIITYGLFFFNPTSKKCTYEKIYAYDKDIKNEKIILV